MQLVVLQEEHVNCEQISSLHPEVCVCVTTGEGIIIMCVFHVYCAALYLRVAVRARGGRSKRFFPLRCASEYGHAHPECAKTNYGLPLAAAVAATYPHEPTAKSLLASPYAEYSSSNDDTRGADYMNIIAALVSHPFCKHTGLDRVEAPPRHVAPSRDCKVNQR